MTVKLLVTLTVSVTMFGFIVQQLLVEILVNCTAHRGGDTHPPHHGCFDKNLGGNKIRWWHIVSGNENDLKSLDDIWEGVRIQAGWKLERCYVESNFLNKERQLPT